MLGGRIKNNTRLKLRMTQVQPIWMKYFELEPAAKEDNSASGEEDSVSRENNSKLDGINKEVN